MLWYKAWLETRWQFLIGLALLMLSACGGVLAYPQVVKLLPLVPSAEVGGLIGQRIREGAELMRDYRGYVWSQWIREGPTQMGTLLAAILGSGGLLAQASGGAAVFTLSLPASRNRLLGVRAATGLGELFTIAVVPMLLVPMLSPAVGESYGVGDALVHAACVFIAGAVFFSLAILLSTVFGDLWRPLLITCAVAVLVGLADAALGEPKYSLFSVMSGESYFRAGALPWGGLLASVALSAAMLYGASVNIARHDF